MANVTPFDSPDVSPTKVIASEKKPNEDVQLALGFKEDNTSVHSKVARLSICGGTGLSKDTIAGIKHSNKKEASADSTDSSSDSLQHKAYIRPKRRRSSAVSLPGTEKFSHTSNQVTKNDKPQTSTVRAKRKKKANKPAFLKISEDTLEKPISIKDLRDLTLYLMDGSNNAPKWVQIDNRNAINKLIVLFVPGLQVEDFNLPGSSKFSQNAEVLQHSHLKYLKDPTLASNSKSFPVTAPGSKMSLFSAYNSFVNVGLTKKEKELRREELKKKKITINDLLLSLEDFIENDYPIHPDTIGIIDQLRRELALKHETEADTILNTRNFEHEGSHTFALDCEMCLSKDGLVLTRVSIIDFNVNTIYDKLVKPDVPIIDYLTKYSGITEEKLAGVTTTLQDVQQDILKIVSASDILIGHSLQSDLNVLKLRHPKVIDTATIFDHKAGPPFRPALRYLASTYLNCDIQTDEGIGHDSIEDSKACMELTKLKIMNGLGFGIAVNTENMFHRLAKSGVKSMRLNDTAPKNQCSWVNTSESALRCTSDSEIMTALMNNIEKYDLFVSRLRDLEFARGYAKPSILHANEIISPDYALSFLADSLKEIYYRSPSGTLILVVSGCGDTRKWSEIMAEMNKMSKEEKVEERRKREEEVQNAVALARDGVAIMCVKQDNVAQSTNNN